MVVEYERWSAIRDDWPNLNRFKEENLKLGSPREGYMLISELAEEAIQFILEKNDQ